MLTRPDTASFAPINRAFNATFQPKRLSLGLVVPIESYDIGAHPTMDDPVAPARLAEDLGFAAVWLRDVPFDVPSFGDVGHIYDPFVLLGLLAGGTQRIGLGVASIILPLRHPAHVAKAAASVDVVSKGRMLLGIASGDRPEEFPAMGKSFQDRGARFRDSYDYISSLAGRYPTLENQHGTLNGSIDMVPKPIGGRLPMLITGGSQQSPDWVAGHGDGWMTYPRDVSAQAQVISDYRRRSAQAGKPDKPVMQSLYVDLLPDDTAPPRSIHLGFQSGVVFLAEYLSQLEAIGVNHVALNLRFNRAGMQPTLERLAKALPNHLID